MKKLGEVRTFKECLSDFFKRYPGHHKDLQTYTGIGDTAERQWRKGRSLPRGNGLLIATHFLEALGYSVKGQSDLQEGVYLIGKYISFGAVGLDQVAKELDYHPFHFQRILRGAFQLPEEKIPVLKGILDKNRDAFVVAESQKKEIARRILGKDHSAVEVETGNSQLIESFDAACAEVRRIGEILLTGDARVRFEMRKKMSERGDHNLHLTWETLNNLLSERKTTHE